MEVANSASSRLPVSSDREIWHTAGLMLQEFGEHAAIKAAQRADEALAMADLESQHLWRRVIRAIAAMTETEGETAH